MITRTTKQLYLLAFASNTGQRFYRFDTCGASMAKTFLAKAAGACPIRLVKAYAADLPGHAFAELVFLLAQQALAAEHLHGEWYRGENDERVMRAISQACAPDQIVLAWAAVAVPPPRPAKQPKRTDLALRKARASVRNSLAMQDAVLEGQRTSVSLADVRSAYR